MDRIGLNRLYRTKLDQIRLNRINVDCIGPKGQNGPNGIKVDQIDQIGLKQTNGPNKTEVDQSRLNGLNGTK